MFSISRGSSRALDCDGFSQTGSGSRCARSCSTPPSQINEKEQLKGRTGMSREYTSRLSAVLSVKAEPCLPQGELSMDTLPPRDLSTSFAMKELMKDSWNTLHIPRDIRLTKYTAHNPEQRYISTRPCSTHGPSVSSLGIHKSRSLPVIDKSNAHTKTQCCRGGMFIVSTRKSEPIPWLSCRDAGCFRKLSDGFVRNKLATNVVAE
jgi:hypothetical protein